MFASFVVALIIFFGTLLTFVLTFVLIGALIGARKPGSAHIRGAGCGYYDSQAREERAPSPDRFAKCEAVDLSHRGRGKEASKWSEGSKSGGRA